MQKDITKLDLISLRNLFFEESKGFLAALETESSEELSIRRERIKEIDNLIQIKKELLQQQIS